jgi:hypothetical protein
MLTGDPFLDVMIAFAGGVLLSITGIVSLCRYGKTREDELEQRLIDILAIVQLRKPRALDEVEIVAREGLQ